MDPDINVTKSYPAFCNIRDEQQEDLPGIREVNLKAFNSQGEADVVDLLRASCSVFISLVATHKKKVIGHILFTPAQLIISEKKIISGLGLAPLAVLPEYQGKGIGSALCRRGIKKIDALGYPFVVVLGHPGFYPRFGFLPAKKHDISCGYQGVPEEAFMIQVFNEEMMKSAAGTVYYRPEFDVVT